MKMEIDKEEIFQRVNVINDIEKVLAILKKTIPKRARPEYGTSTAPVWYECPTCKAMIDDDYLYCNKCGQAIIWEGE
jgi:hypothetical protein